MSDAVRPPHIRTDRCIVWRQRGSTTDRELLEALARRSLVVSQCEDPFAATSALCKGSQGDGALVLLLVDPSRLAMVAEVIAAAKRYAPRAVAWSFETATRRLHAFNLPDAPAQVTAPARPAPSTMAIPPAAEPKLATTRPGRIGPPVLKLAGEGPLPPANEPEDVQTPLSANRPAAQPARQVLTDEELAMLLSPGPIRGNG